MYVSNAIIADIPDTFEVKFVSECQVMDGHPASCCIGSINYKSRQRECTF